jgi:hypothetical protein
VRTLNSISLAFNNAALILAARKDRISVIQNNAIVNATLQRTGTLPRILLGFVLLGDGDGNNASVITFGIVLGAFIAPSSSSKKSPCPVLLGSLVSGVN